MANEQPSTETVSDARLEQFIVYDRSCVQWHKDRGLPVPSWVRDRGLIAEELQRLRAAPEPGERGIGTLLNAGRRALGQYHDGEIGLLVSAHDMAEALAALIRHVSPERQPSTKAGKP